MLSDERENPILVCRYDEKNLAKVIILEKKNEKLDIKLESGITFVGKVTDSEGNIIKDANVRLMLNLEARCLSS